MERIDYDEASILLLPTEILFRLLGFLGIDHLLRTGRTCRAFNNMATTELYDRGTYYVEELYDNFGAIKHFTAVIILQPSHILGYFSRAMAHYKEDEDDDSIADVNQALSLQPIGVDLHLIQALRHQLESNFAGVEEETSKAIAIDGSNGPAYYLRGYNRIDINDYQGSLDDLSFCLTLPFPYKSKVYNRRGDCYENIKQTDKAIADFTASTKLTVRDVKPFVNKAALLLSLYKSKEEVSFRMREEFRRLSDYVEEHSCEAQVASVYYTRGLLKRYCKDYLGAVEDYRIAIQNNYHTKHKAHVSIGRCYVEIKRIKEAIEEYDKALALKPKYTIALELRAEAKDRIGVEGSEEDCITAISINPRNLAYAFRYMAATFSEKSQYEESISILTKGIRANPLNPILLIDRAKNYICLAMLKEAMADFNACLTSQPEMFEAYKLRSHIHFALGDLSSFFSDSKAALALEEDADVLNHTGLAHVALGSFEPAKECFTRAIQLNEDEASQIERNSRFASELSEVIRTHSSRDSSLLSFQPFFVLNEGLFEEHLRSLMADVLKDRIDEMFP